MDVAGISAALGAFRLPRRASVPETARTEDASESAPLCRPRGREEARRSAPRPEAGFRPPPRPLPAPEALRASALRLLPASALEKRSLPTVKSPSTASRDRSFERIIEASARAPTLPGTKMQLSVHSAEWGALRIELVVKGSEVRASVVTESGAARDAIVSQLEDLRARLEGRGLRLGEFCVSVEGSSEAAADGDGTAAPRSLRPQVLDVVV